MIMLKITIPIRMPWNIKWALNEKPLAFAHNILLTDLVFSKYKHTVLNYEVYIHPACNPNC